MDAAKETTWHEALLRNVKFYLPVDCVVADRLDKQAETKIIPVQEVPKDWLIADIGPATVTLFGEALQNAKTIVWNGPMGAFEVGRFQPGHHGHGPEGGGFLCPDHCGRPATPTSPCTRPGIFRNFPMSPPAAAPSSNCWKAKSCRVSWPWKPGPRDQDG